MRLFGLFALVLLLSACAPREVAERPLPHLAIAPFVATDAAIETPVEATPEPTSTLTPGVSYPDPVRTPGDVFPVGLETICVTGYTKTVRNVPSDLKERIYAEYGITRPRLPNEFEMDHLVPLAIGGSNDPRNLWPQAAEPKPGFHEKDQLEVRLLALVCSGSLDLREAQRAVATDWYATYRRYYLRLDN